MKRGFPYMNIANTINKYATKAIRANENYFMIVRSKNDLFYCCNGKSEHILSLYITMDFGSGMSKYLSYDKYVSAVPAPALRIVGHNDKKLICTLSDSECQLIGFDETEIAEAEDASIVHQARNIFIYCRTKFYHTFIFADLEHNNIRIIEDFADVDEAGNARPDAVTSNMASFFARTSKLEETPSDAANEVIIHE